MKTWTFWLQLLLNPVKTLDLVNAKGEPDHGKVLPAIVSFWILTLALLDKLPSVGHTVALLSASFGYASWRTFLSARPTQEVKDADATIRNG